MSDRRDHRPPHITHATIPAMEGCSPGPRPILLKYETSIIVVVSYGDTIPDSIQKLYELVQQFHDEDEAESIMRCIEADQRWLSYAIG